ncbi:integrase family protein [Pseudomonas sp. GD03862]|uniref:tyrosine-type recombinase/integrase n=1 Tax=Pseudomonas sp. GD03862 TaxID=2975391 RepID=UPI00244746C7|nr:integrase family protein [Pseudomonas sp. GD03862]MDH0707046.1 integrase family protein [Pseudomonas sp. GD03862]
MSSNVNFTQVALNGLPLPAPGERAVYHDFGGSQSVSGLEVRVTSTGVKTFSVFKRVAGGKPERVTIGKFPEVSIDQARKKAKAIIADLAAGVSPSETKREARVQGMTLAEAMTRYIEEQTREDNGMHLKARTRSDYLGMIQPSRQTAKGKATKGGLLRKLANKPIRAIAAYEIKAVNDENKAQRGERQATYAMQVLRAVLNFYGVKVKNGPFDKETPKANRITTPKTQASEDAPVEALLENLGAFWRALGAVQTPTGDYLRFLLLTGCRPGEPLRVPVADCNMAAGKVLLRDTKTRTDHVLLLSRQGLEIVQRQVEGRAPTERLFPITNVEAHQLAHELSATTALTFTPKNLRATFTSIASELVSVNVYKRIMNRGKKNDTDDKHYIKILEAQMREGWQKVADHIEATAADNVIPISVELS